MKNNKFLLLCITCVISVSCQNKTFDLATIKLNEDAEKYKLDKSSIFEKAPFLSSENISAYDSNEEYEFTIGGIPIDSTYTVWLTVINNKIGSVEINIKSEYTLQFAEKLLAELGPPTAIFTEQTCVNPEIEKQIFNEVHSVFPDSTQWIEDSNYPIKYPYALFWEKENVYYIYSMTIDLNGKMRNRYYPVTKEAFRTGKIREYLYPIPEDSPLYNYMK